MRDVPPTDAEILARIAAEIVRGVAHSPVGRDPRTVEPAAARAPAPPVQMTPQGQHLAKLAHELKTPLSAIVAAAEIMRDERLGALGERYQGYAAGIHESASHALGVINAMLGSEAVPSERQAAMAFTPVDLNAMAELTVASVRALMEAAGLTITHDLKPGLPHVIADAVTVRQMLLNLVTNAMRATPAGGTLTVATAFDLAGPVSLTVTDTGSGMSDDDIACALDPTRDADFTRRPTGGLGIGYPLILHLARLNGAAITIESVVPQGTRVCIRFGFDRTVPV
jgi:two-component system, cell cycle sensor histidine kinase PleC